MFKGTWKDISADKVVNSPLNSFERGIIAGQKLRSNVGVAGTKVVELGGKGKDAAKTAFAFVRGVVTGLRSK